MSYRLYVARLKPQVLEHRRYREANPHYIPGKPCVYVGATGRTREWSWPQEADTYSLERGGSPRCHEQDSHIRRSSGNRWFSWSKQAVRLRN